MYSGLVRLFGNEFHGVFGKINLAGRLSEVAIGIREVV
jgi:hypothetical protein